MATLELPFRSAVDLAKALRRREVSARELLDLYWARVEKHNPSLNAIVVSDIGRARWAAASADRRLSKGEPLGPLDGIPMTVKESFDWAGTPTTWGSPLLKGNIAAEDALALQRLQGAGAVVFGKTNVPLMLADWQTFNAVYGTTNNPWNPGRVPGGSSGGSAAALAAGLTALEIGSDIGASIRNPAHYCGVCGHKPSFGIVPMRGHRLPGRVAYTDISVAGPLARSASDLELALGILAGPDGPEGRGFRFRLPPPRHRRLADFRVAVMLTDPVSEVDQAVIDVLVGLVGFLKSRVKVLSLAARPEFSTAEANEVYIMLLRAATSSRQSEAEFAANHDKAAGLDAADHSYYARMLRASTMPHRQWLEINNRRHQLRLLWDRFFAEWDVLLSPAAASAAFPHDHKGERHERTIPVNGHEVPTTDQLFWAGYSGAFYLPATVVPAGLTGAGLPVGVQIVAAQGEDLTAIRFARLIEQNYYRFTPPPLFA